MIYIIVTVPYGLVVSLHVSCVPDASYGGFLQEIASLRFSAKRGFINKEKILAIDLQSRHESCENAGVNFMGLAIFQMSFNNSYSPLPHAPWAGE